MKTKVINMRERKINRIIELLEEEQWTEVMLIMLPVFETYREDDFYIPNDEDGLKWLLDQYDMESFVGIIKSDEYDIYDDLIRYQEGNVISVGYDVAYEDFINLITSEDCTDEILNEIIDTLGEFEL
jgi:hypothetical protein